ncbi:MAG: sigma-54 dependent transcriptional regulator [bacterium]|nr:sigma-54 dependent transcriptional regulator [bacterium]
MRTLSRTNLALADATVLLVDDDPNYRKVVAYNLTKLGAVVTAAGDGRKALELLSENAYDLVLTDVKMPGMDGLELLAAIRSLHKEIPVILVTAHGDIEMAVEAMQAGAFDFVTKPFDRQRLAEKIERALKLPRLERENRALREELGSRYAFESIIGSSTAMRELFDLMNRVVHRDTTILILGESGAGKELVARALHYHGPRSRGPFVAINCAAIPPTLLESELFGHAKGAYTGADAAREGRFQAASGGSLFLDEIGDMSLELQAKLLRVLQERRVEPVGSNQSIAVDVRIMAATNQDLEKLVKEGEFRRDLYYRLNVVPLHLPPLRDRRDDIPLLARHFLGKFGEPDVRIEPGAMEKLMSHAWPGNVRELENSIERALALRAHPDRITADDLLRFGPAAAGGDVTLYEIPDEGIVFADLEKRLIVSALHKAGNNQTRAAKLLGLSRQQLIYRMQKHDLS